MKSMLQQAVGLAVVLVVALLNGCSGDGGKKTVYKVQGKVLDAKKKPAVGVIVTFQPVGAATDAIRPTATTDEQGNYMLTTYTQGDGAPAGDYIITAVWPAPRRSPLDPAAGADQLNGRLAKSESSPHKFTVEKKSETQQVPDLTLP